MSYSTYLGGSGFDIATDVAVDATGSVYVTGYTNSFDFPSPGPGLALRGGGTCGSGEDTYPCFDLFVAKFDPAGRSLVYVAYLGGSGDDFATGIAVDSSDNVYITGYTNSQDFPTSNAVQAYPGGGTCGAAPATFPCFDAFVAKLDAAGSTLVYSTYWGGSGDDYAQGVAVDSAGRATVAGFTASADFPTRAAMSSSPRGGYDAFLTQLGPTGAPLTFATFLGGAGDDFATRVAVDGAGDIYLTGYTNSADFLVVSAAQSAYAAGTCGALSSAASCFDAFVMKVRGDGSGLEYSTFLGGTGGDYGYGIAVDASGSAYVTGLTTSVDFPVTYHAFQTAGGGNNTDAFVAQLDPSGAALVYATYLGGLGAEAGYGVAVDADGRAFVTGYAYGSGFPLTNPVQTTAGGFYDAFLAILNESGTALEFSTYLGGAGNEKARAAAVDPYRNVYIVGETFSTNCPTARAFQASYAGGAFDAFVARIAAGDSPVLYASSSQLDFGTQPVSTSSPAQTLTLTNIGGGELHFVGFDLAGDFSESTDCPGALSPGASCGVSVVFMPTVAGPRAGTLTVTSDAPGQPFSVALSGTGVPPAITVSASAVAFGRQLVGTKSAPQIVSVTNTGAAPLQLSGISVTGDFAQTNNCSGSIAIGDSCTIVVTFAPVATGSRPGSLVITNSLPEETHQAALSGTGTDFALAGAPGIATITAGETATYTLTISPLGGFQEPVVLTCTGVPSAANCLLAPASLTLDGTNAATAKVTITTTARSSAVPSRRPLSPPSDLRGLLAPRPPFSWVAWLWVLGALALLGGARRRCRRWALACLILVLLLCDGCGGGGGASPTVPPSGTPPGTYTLTLTGTYDGVSRSTSVRLTIR